jgi:hypothetical protein
MPGGRGGAPVAVGVTVVLVVAVAVVPLPSAFVLQSHELVRRLAAVQQDAVEDGQLTHARGRRSSDEIGGSKAKEG